LQTGDFCMTYGDGVTNLDIGKLIAFHEDHGHLATVTAVRPPGRFGALELTNGRVNRFSEKPPGDDLRVNGGFFVLSPQVFDYLDDDSTVFEQGPLQRLASDGELMSYVHEDFWHSMDTLRDKINLEKLWTSGEAPWKVW
jgi:glucose-1-phosphate cytidylyltransferase